MSTNALKLAQNFPAALRSLPQWVIAYADKAPYDPKGASVQNPSGRASVTDPSTWGTFDQALQSYIAWSEDAPKKWIGIGFVLVGGQNVSIIDLDDKPEKPLSVEQQNLHNVIRAKFESYTEKSLSGRGVHIIVGGSIPRGVHRDSVEVYSDARYMICTGDIIGAQPKLITNQQENLDILYDLLRPEDSYDYEVEDGPVTMNDYELVEKCSSFNNENNKFTRLYNGDWESLGYPSASEADIALLAILAFYSRNNEQVISVFRSSDLANPQKRLKHRKITENDKYLLRSLAVIRRQQSRDKFAEEQVVQELDSGRVSFDVKQTTTERQNITSNQSWPPGLVGDIARYIYSTAYRQVPEVAITGALGFFAGICARSYNISNKGLNLYIVLVGKTGIGKDGIHSGTDALYEALSDSIPQIFCFKGGTFASAPALLRQLSENPCFCSYYGEFGETLRVITDPNASEVPSMLRRSILELYGTSGANRTYRPHSYSDKMKNIPPIQNPCFTLVGEGTQSSVFKGLSEDNITSGLVPRFIIVEACGDRPNPNPNAGITPPPELLERISRVVQVAISTAANGTCSNVGVNPGAHTILTNYDRECTEIINSHDTDFHIQVELANRAAENAMRLAALLAVGRDEHSPYVTEVEAQWAVDFVKKSVALVTAKFTDGSTDNSTANGDSYYSVNDLVATFIKAWFNMSAKERMDRGFHKSIAELTGPIIPDLFLKDAVRMLGRGFQLTKEQRVTMKALNMRTLKELLKFMEESGYLVKVRIDAYQEYTQSLTGSELVSAMKVTLYRVSTGYLNEIGLRID